MKARWQKTDRPLGAQHLDMGTCGARVRPISSGWEWSTWIGDPGRRVMHGQGTRVSLSAAKKLAATSCARLVRR